jgi:outer membrane autotransporter protein
MNTSLAGMQGTSKRASTRVSKLRTELRNNQAPSGPPGPDTETLVKGDWLSYTSAFGNIGGQDSSSTSPGFDYDTYGLMLGQEKLIGEQLIVGLAGAYAQTDIKSPSGDSDSNLYSATAYANWFNQTWYVGGGLTYGHAENDVTRIDSVDDRYTGGYDSALVGTWIEAGYTAALGDFGIGPYGRLSYVHGEHDGYTDTGSGTSALTTEDSNTDNLKSELGMRVNLEWVYQNRSSFIIEVKAGWEHEWADEGVSVNASYLGSTLDIESAQADEDALVLGLRMEWSNGRGFSAGVDYEPTFAGNWHNHAFSGTLRHEW